MASQTLLYYLDLRKAYPSNDGELVLVTMEGLSQLFFCSQRNVKIVLTKMIQMGWIDFVSGRGRGNKSSLKFLKTTQDILVDQAGALISHGQLSEAVELIKLYGHGTNARATVIELLGQFFGYTTENHAEAKIETLRIPIFRPINTLDPASVFYDFDGNLIDQIFNRLVTVNELTKEIEGQLAHFWTSDDEATHWIFYLRKGVLFHHGREMTANDVTYTLTRLKNSSQNWMVSNIKNVSVLDRYTIAVNLHEPNYLFLKFLSYTPMSIVPADVCESNQDGFATYPIGTGPFKCLKCDSWSCILEAFPSYYAERAHLDRVEIHRLPEDVQEWNPEHPGLDRLFVNHGESTAYKDDAWDAIEEIYEGSTVLTMNLSKSGPQASYHFRRAISCLINRSKLIVELGSTRMYPSQGFKLRSNPSYFDVDYNPSLVGTLLENADYHGETLHLYTFGRHLPDAVWIREQCLLYGIRIHIHVVEWDELLYAQNIQKADCILFEAVTTVSEVQQLELYQFSNSFIRLHLNEEFRHELDRSIQAIMREPYEEIRREMFLGVERVMKEEANLVFLVHKKMTTTFHPTVRGVRVGPRAWIDLKAIWFSS